MRLTLCGSARFEAEFHVWNEKLTLSGHVVYSLSVYPSSKAGTHEWYDGAQKQTLDLAHLAKISASDGVVIINNDNYVGDSARRELEWAIMNSKAVYWTEDPGLPAWRYAGNLINHTPWAPPPGHHTEKEIK